MNNGSCASYKTHAESMGLTRSLFTVEKHLINNQMKMYFLRVSKIHRIIYCHKKEAVITAKKYLTMMKSNKKLDA